jgi:hypothetical protein
MIPTRRDWSYLLPFISATQLRLLRDAPYERGLIVARHESRDVDELCRFGLIEHNLTASDYVRCTPRGMEVALPFSISAAEDLTADIKALIAIGLMGDAKMVLLRERFMYRVLIETLIVGQQKSENARIDLDLEFRRVERLAYLATKR